MKTQLNSRAIAEIAIFAAIAFILDFLQEKIWNVTPLFANGGSIGIALVPIIVIALRRGVVAGGICGLATGLLQMMGGFYAVAGSWYYAMAQVLLDYTLTYMLAGLAAGIFHHFINFEEKTNKTYVLISVACFLAAFAKFLSHFLAGAIFWANYDFAGGPWVYSLLYNGAYMLPNAALAIVIVDILFAKRKEFFVLEVAK